MYAKLFTSIYQGTLRGNSHGLLVFTNLLAHADSAGTADIHPRAIAEEVGLSVEQVRAALLVLEAPDEESRSHEEEGRRITRVDSHRAWGWRIVNYLKYRAIRSEEDRREQNRLAQERFRNKSKPSSAELSPDQPRSAHTEADTEEEVEVEAKNTKTPRKRAAPTGLVSVSALVDAGLDEKTALDFIDHKARLKAPLTDRAWADHLAECKKAGWSAQQAAEKVMAKSWKGFEAKYVAGELQAGRSQLVPQRKSDLLMAGNIAAAQRFLESSQ